MRPLRRLAQYYVDLLVKLGIWKFSMLLALAIVAFAMVVQMSVTWVFEGKVEKIDILRSIFFGVLITPWAVYFLSVVVDQLEASRQQLTQLVDELEELHEREAKHNKQLSINIKQLNQEIVDRIKAEQARLQVVEQLKEEVMQRKRYQDALEQASRDKTTFISTISHELRTPLNGIIGLSRILADGVLDDKQRNYLNTIQVSAVTLSHIFNDIIEVDKWERNQQKIDIQPVDFTQFLSDLENIATLLCQQKGIQFELMPLFAEKQQQLPLQIMTDETRLRQILWNLISNAVKFTEQGQITIRVYFSTQKSNQLTRSEQELIFEVEDTGRGIPATELEKIFGMYYQVKDKLGGKPATGTGIGLAVSKSLAQRLGGDISVASQPNEGSCFTVSVITAVLETGLNDDTVNQTFVGYRVLLVEDIELNVVVASAVLEKLGCNVDVAMTGEEALQKIEPGSHDLILLDIQLPDMTGLDIAKALTKRYKKHELPRLIALTANILDDYSSYYQVGIESVINKPLSIKELVETINRTALQNKTNRSNGIDYHLSNKGYDINMIEYDHQLIEEYVQMIGADALLMNVELFSQSMPDYLLELKSAIEMKQLEEVGAIGHKIKGASASLGLRTLQKIAKQVQDFGQSAEHVDEEQPDSNVLGNNPILMKVDWSEVEQLHDLLVECWPLSINQLNSLIKSF